MYFCISTINLLYLFLHGIQKYKITNSINYLWCYIWFCRGPIFDEKWKFKKERKSNMTNGILVIYRIERVREKLTNCEHDWEWHTRNWIISQFNLRDLVLSASIRVSAFPRWNSVIVFLRNGCYFDPKQYQFVLY